MDRDYSTNRTPPTPAELHALRDANRTSTQVPAGMLDKLKSLQSNVTSAIPEISVLKIPAVSVGPVPDASAADDSIPETIPWGLPKEFAPRAEQSPTQSGLPLSSSEPLSSIPKSGSAPAPAPTVASSPPPGKPHRPTTTTPVNRETKREAPTLAWYQSISSGRDERPIQEICQRILSQFPRQTHAQLLFTSADPALSTNRTVGKIAHGLVQSTSGDVLLVDANWDANLAIAKNRDNPQLGLAEVLAQGFDWRPLVLATQTVGLRVLPCGASDVPARQIESSTLQNLAAEWRRDYAYVLINAGMVKQLLTRRFALCSDGAYVMVELNRTTKSQAQAAAKILAEYKARTMGAIVFDSAIDS